MVEAKLLCDAHCHPTDHPDQLDEIAQMNACSLAIMATRMDDLDLVYETSQKYPDKTIAAFGYHPWFSHLVYTTPDPPESALDHYKEVLVPTPTEEFVELLPFPKSFDEHLNRIENYLKNDPNSIVGECGLDKAFTLPIPGSNPRNLSQYHVSMDHQKEVFMKQLELASTYNRPVSIHGVHCPQTVYDCIINMENQPPSICLHSFTGSPAFLQSWFTPGRKQKKPKTKVFVSGSVLINITSEEKAVKLASHVPLDRILVESDYHVAGRDMDNYLMESFTRFAKAYNLEFAEAEKQFYRNYRNFVSPDSI